MEYKELIKLAYDMGAHPYSVGGMVAALQKGIEIGKKEQEAIDKAKMETLVDRVIWLIEDSYPDTTGWTHSELVEGVKKELISRSKELNEMFYAIAMEE